ncbi:MAG: hypothetical protein WC865_11085 [Bacteroidales bacterium]
MPTNSHITSLALQLGATRSAIVNVSDIQFAESFRDLCEMNSCGIPYNNGQASVSYVGMILF